jgi:hypothetical protein
VIGKLLSLVSVTVRLPVPPAVSGRFRSDRPRSVSSTAVPARGLPVSDAVTFQYAHAAPAFTTTTATAAALRMERVRPSSRPLPRPGLRTSQVGSSVSDRTVTSIGGGLICSPRVVRTLRFMTPSGRFRRRTVC